MLFNYDNRKVDNCNKILDGVYLGNYVSASKKYLLERYGITHILTVGSNLKPKFALQYTYKIIEEFDVPTANLRQHWDTCHEFIDSALAEGGTVLVHCYAGVSRSASTLIAYMMRKYNLSMYNAM
jgi:dual specificity phosphatase 12